MPLVVSESEVDIRSPIRFRYPFFKLGPFHYKKREHMIRSFKLSSGALSCGFLAAWIAAAAATTVRSAQEEALQRSLWQRALEATGSASAGTREQRLTSCWLP